MLPAVAIIVNQAELNLNSGINMNTINPWQQTASAVSPIPPDGDKTDCQDRLCIHSPTLARVRSHPYGLINQITLLASASATLKESIDFCLIMPARTFLSSQRQLGFSQWFSGKQFKVQL